MSSLICLTSHQISVKRFHAARDVLLPSIPGFQILLFVLSIQTGTYRAVCEVIFTNTQNKQQDSYNMQDADAKAQKET